jgi:SAM-dependent methyltransferase
MGFMFTEPEAYMTSFVDYAAKTSGPVLDIGAAYGITTISALEKGAFVVANDIDERHLDILKSKIPPSLLKNLELIPGKFPSDLDFPENHFSAILASRVLHFLHPNLMKQSISVIYKWLKPGGKFFYLGTTPYYGTFKKFLPQYLKNKQEGREWPGFVEDVPFYAPERCQNLPSFYHLIDDELLTQLLVEVGFKIEKMSYVPAQEGHPQGMKLDGREHLGAIAIKP